VRREALIYSAGARIDLHMYCRVVWLVMPVCLAHVNEQWNNVCMKLHAPVE